MKRRVFKLTVAVILLLGTSSLMAAGISGSKHDLTVNGGGTIKALSGENNNELCVYCHTPHAANSGFIGAPLWNKAAVNTGANAFQMYGAGSAGVAGVTLGLTATDAAPNNPSKACLSCHDGVNAINSMVNAPGSGGYNSAGALTTFNGVSTATVMGATSVTNIGVDLRNDHPISITYDDTKASLRATSTALIGTWTTPSGTQTIAAILRDNKVECSTCHDPHLGDNDTFLRRAKTNGFSNDASNVCISCHAK